MLKKLTKKNDLFSVDTLIDILDEMQDDNEKRLEFQKFYKSFLVKSAENILSNQSTSLKSLLEETEVLSHLIKEKTKEFEELAKEIYVMGLFEGAYDAFGTWYKMYSDSSDFEMAMTKLLSKKHVKQILNCLQSHPGIQNKKILEIVDIKPNYLSQLTSEMMYYQIVSRYSVGKNTFYELTPRAKEFLNKNQKYEISIDISISKMDMYKELIKNKELIESEFREPFFEKDIDIEPIEHRKIYVGNFDIELERNLYNV